MKINPSESQGGENKKMLVFHLRLGDNKTKEETPSWNAFGIVNCDALMYQHASPHQFPVSKF